MKGRGNGTAITTNSAMRLEINNLIKGKHLIYGSEIQFISSWTNGAEIGITSCYNDNEIYLRLTYTVNKTTKYDYKIYIERIKSNLGKGHNHYFICPESLKRCKILYLCYGAERFKCRQAYNNRIYYKSQIHSKEYRLNGRYFHFTEIIDKMYEMRKTKLYKGKQTKRDQRLIKLLNKRAEVDELRNEQLNNWLYRYLGLNS